MGRAGEALALGRADEAERLYRAALQRAPEHGALHGALAALLGKQARFPEAKVVAQRYTEVAPNDARAWFLLGVVRENLGERGGAVKAFTQGLKVARATGDQQRAQLLEQALQRNQP
jgi:Flp pilus assembly protein TadD